MIRVLSTIFSGFYKGITLQFHVDWTSLVIAVCAGVLLTFIVAAFSAYKVSRLNIVAAIRNLAESEQRGTANATRCLDPSPVASPAAQTRRRGPPHVCPRP